MQQVDTGKPRGHDTGPAGGAQGTKDSTAAAGADYSHHTPMMHW